VYPGIFDKQGDWLNHVMFQKVIVFKQILLDIVFLSQVSSKQPKTEVANNDVKNSIAGCMQSSPGGPDFLPYVFKYPPTLLKSKYQHSSLQFTLHSTQLMNTHSPVFTRLEELEETEPISSPRKGM
jgi:hypothetical protein